MRFDVDLRRLLLKLPKDGKKFELLIVLAMEKVLGRRVWPARSGSQFGADMGTGAGEWPVIKVEAKRCNKGSDLKNRELLGEISEAVASCPELDLWVLASSAEVPEQIEKSLTQEGRQRGIGVEIIDLSPSERCKLPRLLAGALDDVSRFIQLNLGEAEGQQVRSLLKKIRERHGSDDTLRRQLINASSLFDFVAATARVGLQEQLRSPAQSRVRFNQVVHSDSFVRRQAAFDALEQWYSEQHQQGSIFALCGEEGMGKTWAATVWLANKVGETNLLPVILTSSHAASMATIAHGIAECLCALLPGVDESHWRRRVLRWLDLPAFRSRMVMLIDGLNEQPKADWRQVIDQILSDDDTGPPSSTGGDLPKTKFATIVTCRTCFWQQKFAVLSGWRIDQFEIDLFSNDELREYLRRNDRRLEEFNRDIWDLLKIPRFCDLAITHHHRLLQSGDISRDRLIYEDWRDRYERKNNFALDDHSFQNLMVDLAEQALQGKKQYREREFRNYLPQAEPEKILVELKTGGILVRTVAGKLEVDPPRLYHALGLLLLSELVRKSDAPEEDLQELIARHFEPSGIDAHASICAAAIFGATIQDAPQAVILLLFETFFALQNIQEHEWEKIRGFFPVFPEIYRQLAERLVCEPDRPRKAWETVEWAYLRWCDDEVLQPILEQHCQRWFSFLPLDSPWRPQDEKKQEEYTERLRLFLGRSPEPGSMTVSGAEFILVDSRDLHRIQNLAIEVLSVRAATINPMLFRTWALSHTVQEYIGRDNAVWWLVRLLDVPRTRTLVQQIECMLEVDNPIWQAAAFHLAGMLPDERAKQLQDKSTHEHLSTFRRGHAEDPCEPGLWLDENCAGCLRRKDVDFKRKANNIACRSNDPNFSLPEDCSKELLIELGALLATFDGYYLHSSYRTSRRFDLERWEPAFTRWLPREFSTFAKSLIESFETDNEGDESDEGDKDDTRGEGGDRKLLELEHGARNLNKIALILDRRDFEKLLAFWRGHVRQPLASRSRGSSKIDILEVSVFLLLILLAEGNAYANIIIERPEGEFDDRRFIDVQPSGMNRDQLLRCWERIFMLPQERLVSKLFFLALDEPALSLQQRQHLVDIAQDRESDVHIGILALLSNDVELVRQLLKAGAGIFFGLVSELYWIPVDAIPTDISVEYIESISTPLLSHLIEKRGDAAAHRRFAQLLREFVEAGKREWQPWPIQPTPRYWCSFSYPAVRKALSADPQCLVDLLARLDDPGGIYTPIRHSFWLYYSVCEYLLDESAAQAIPLLDRLIEEKYVGNNDTPCPHGIISLMARWSRNPEVSSRLSECLDLCVTDSALQSFALAFNREADLWLWEKIESDLASARHIIVARALTLAGFAHDFDRAITLLELQETRTTWWLEAVRTNSLAIAKKACWSKYWFDIFLSTGNIAESWAAFQLFFQCVDRRYYSWAESSFELYEFSFRDRSLKMRHLRVNQQQVNKKIEDHEKKNYAKGFCHSRITEGIFPWMKQWKLSAENSRRIITG